MLTVLGNELGDSSSNLKKAVYISHNVNPLGKGIYPMILTPATDK